MLPPVIKSGMLNNGKQKVNELPGGFAKRG
jgi:hypothetical protein